MELEKWGLRKKTVRCLPVGEIRVSSDRRSAGLELVSSWGSSRIVFSVFILKMFVSHLGTKGRHFLNMFSENSKTINLGRTDTLCGRSQVTLRNGLAEME